MKTSVILNDCNLQNYFVKSEIIIDNNKMSNTIVHKQLLFQKGPFIEIINILLLQMAPHTIYINVIVTDMRD